MISSARQAPQEIDPSTASGERAAILHPVVPVKGVAGVPPSTRWLRRDPTTFFALVFLLSSPLYVLTALACLNVGVGFPELGGLYISVATAVPFVSAYALSRREAGRAGVDDLRRRSFAVMRGKGSWWYAVASVLGPLRFLLSYALMRALPLGGGSGDLTTITDSSIPPPMAPALAVPLVVLLCVLMATGEEVGWMGYAFDAMEAKASGGALPTALVLGVVWALWHVPFFVFMFPHPKVLYVGSEVVALVFDRIVAVWIYRNTARSVVAVILYHAMDNVALITFPDIKAVAPWGPALPCIFSVFFATTILSLWDSRTLTRCRFRETLSSKAFVQRGQKW